MRLIATLLALVALLAPVGPVGAKTKESGWSIAQKMEDASRFCAEIDPAYQVDCLAERIEWVAYGIDSYGAYAKQRQLLLTAAKQMKGVADTYWDKSGKKQAYRSAGAQPQTNRRELRPIAPASRQAAVGAARSIVVEAQTVLLRSAASQPDVAPQIQRIAAAVGSNKSLLRSA